MKKSCLLLLCCLALPGPAGFSQSPADSLRRIYATAPVDSVKWLALFHLSQWHSQQNIDSAIWYAQQGLAFAEKKAPQLVARSLNNVGLQYMNRGDLDKALDYYLQSIEAARKINCQPCLATTVGNLGIIYWNKKELNKAEEQFRQAIQLAKDLQDTVMLARHLNNLGLVLTDKGQIREAEAVYQDVLRLMAAKDTLYLQPLVYGNLGNIYYAKGDYPKALEFYQQEYKLSEQTGDAHVMFIGTTNSGWAYLAMKQYDQAVALFSQGLAIAEKHKNEKNIESAYGSLADAYKARGDYPKAFSALEKYLQVHDSLQAQASSKAVLEMETRFRTQEKEAQLARQELTLARETNLRNWLIGLAILAILVVAAVFQLLRNREILRKRKAELALQLEQSEAEKLRELDRLKSNFFANVSHEFRTPITLILSPLDQLLDGTFRGDQRRYFQIMRRNAQRLLQLVNQLLDLSRLESGRMHLQLAESDLAAFVRALAWSFESLASRKQIAFDVQTPAEPVVAWFDRDKVEKILTNLLTNAFKFTPEEGAVGVQLAVENGQAMLSVRDTGIGIPAAQLAHIFERFYQVNQTPFSDTEAGPALGTGIGLALIKELVDLHGGQIRVESQEGKGSTFTVLLPLAKDMLPAGANIVTLPPEPDAPLRTADTRPVERKTGATLLESTGAGRLPVVLIVEDNTDVRNYVREQLAGQYQLHEASNGRIGLERAIETVPDLIITDIMMPEMDGVSLARRLKSDERTSHIPLILLTAKADQEEKLEGLETGADAYLTKPFDVRELRVRIRQLIEQREKLQAKYRQSALFAPQKVDIPSMDDAFLHKVREAIEANLDDETFSVIELSQQVSMSRSQLHRKLKALTGYGPNEIIRHIRLERARQLLEQKVGTVSEVAFRVGFNSLAYFSKCFSEHFGYMPSQV